MEIDHNSNKQVYSQPFKIDLIVWKFYQNFVRKNEGGMFKIDLIVWKLPYFPNTTLKQYSLKQT